MRERDIDEAGDKILVAWATTLHGYMPGSSPYVDLLCTVKIIGLVLKVDNDKRDSESNEREGREVNPTSVQFGTQHWR